MGIHFSEQMLPERFQMIVIRIRGEQGYEKSFDVISIREAVRTRDSRIDIF